MSIPFKPLPAKLFMSILFCEAQKSQLGELVSRLEETFGPTDYTSECLKFDYTDYYAPEMGNDLSRVFVAFAPLIERDGIIEVKQKTNQLEMEYSDGEKRRFNLDPGLVTPENIMLSTNKNFTHRIYLGKGVYGEITLLFRNKSYRPLDWTFPDYASQQVIAIFMELRKRYMSGLKKLK